MVLLRQSLRLHNEYNRHHYRGEPLYIGRLLSYDRSDSFYSHIRVFCDISHNFPGQSGLDQFDRSKDGPPLALNSVSRPVDRSNVVDTQGIANCPARAVIRAGLSDR